MKPALLALPALFFAAVVQAAEPIPLDRSMASQLADPARHRQPTVVALWSLDCSHCKKNLQILSDLAKKHRRLRVLTVAAEVATAEHQPLLTRFALPGPAYAYGNDSPESLAYALDSGWAGELPRTFLYDGKGGQRKVSGVLSAIDIERATGLR